VKDLPEPVKTEATTPFTPSSRTHYRIYILPFSASECKAIRSSDSIR